jgi:hypothetical protein
MREDPALRTLIVSLVATRHSSRLDDSTSLGGDIIGGRRRLIDGKWIIGIVHRDCKRSGAKPPPQAQKRGSETTVGEEVYFPSGQHRGPVSVKHGKGVTSALGHLNLPFPPPSLIT